MEHKKIVSLALLVCTLFFFVGVILSIPEKIGLCSQDIECIDKLGSSYGEPFVLSSLCLGLIFLILRFLPKEIFKTWLFFATWYIPVAAALTFLAPATSGGLFPIDKEVAVLMLGGIYLAVSILIIVIRLLFLKFYSRKKVIR